MLPKIDIQVPELLLRCFYFPTIYGPREKLDRDIKKFKDFFEKHGDSVLTEIENFSGYSWSMPRIPVYLVPNNSMLPYSFSRPNLEDNLPGIIQKIGRGVRDIHIHIHELVHTNQKQSEFYTKFAYDKEGKRDTDLLELCADIVTIYVIRKLFQDNSVYENDMWDFLKNTNDKNKRKEELLEQHIEIWDLNKNNLKHFLETS
jgi:hypothetical protein